MTVMLCPNCHGQKTVSKPPWMAYPCPTCSASGFLWSINVEAQEVEAAE